MIFAFVQDGTLSVLAGLDEARRRFSASDVETDAVQFFDERGMPLAPSFPNRAKRRVLGIVVGESAGPFELAPATADGAERLDDVLGEVHVVMGGPRFATVDDVRAHLAAVR